MIQNNKSTEMEEMVGPVKDERRSDGVPEQPAGVLQIIDRLENIAEQMMPDNERSSDGVPEQPEGILQIIDRLENIAEQMMPDKEKRSDGVLEQQEGILQIIVEKPDNCRTFSQEITSQNQPVENLFRCSVCTKSFCKEKSLKIHFRLHSREKSNTVDVQFVTNYSLVLKPFSNMWKFTENRNLTPV